jgi:hypothetical protein
MDIADSEPSIVMHSGNLLPPQKNPLSEYNLGKRLTRYSYHFASKTYVVSCVNINREYYVDWSPTRSSHCLVRIFFVITSY